MMTIKVNNGSKNWIIRQHTTNGGWSDIARIVIDESEIHTFIETFLKGVHGLAMFPEKTSESSGHSFTEGMDIGATQRCTQPNCDCVEQAEKKAGGPVKKYQCLAPSEPPRMKSGFTPNRPTIPEQIAWLHQQLATKELGHAQDYFISMIEVLSRVEKTKKELNSLQQFVLEWAGFRTLEYEPKTNEHSIYGERKLDLEKVIDDLIQVIADAGLNRTNGVPIPSIQNAEAALGMLQAFKGKTITAKDVADAHHAGKNVLDRKTWSQYPKEMQQVQALTKEIIYRRVARMLHNTNEYGEAKAIIYAIEQMAKLND